MLQAKTHAMTAAGGEKKVVRSVNLGNGPALI
jgi:hypothetical protein